MRDHILKTLQSHHDILDQLLSNTTYLEVISKAAEVCIHAFKNTNKVLFCGNGGSAADAQHLAAELSGRYLIDRAPLFAEALHVNTSYLTAVANDYHFNDIYSRAIQAKGRPQDVLVALSTSGQSENIVTAMKQAKQLDMTTIAFTSTQDKSMEKWSDVHLAIPSDSTPRIQEMHILCGHIMCELIERKLFL